MLKRAFDVLISFLALLLLSPFLLLVSVLVFVFLGWPVFFLQKRVGLNNETFTLIKFRSMRVAPPGTDPTSTDSLRLTAFGKLLRSSSLDELPELINVICGHMSIVGPRPLLVDYLPLYSDRQIKRHEVRPGITGYAQVRGRNRLSWEERFELDVFYVENRNLIWDLGIIFETVWHVIRRSDVEASEGGTMSPFRGSADV